MRTYIFQSHIQLENPSKRFQINFSGIEFYRILTAVNIHRYRSRTWLRNNGIPTIHLDFRRREGDDIVILVIIGYTLVDLNRSGARADMPDGKFQRGPLALVGAELINFPLERILVQQARSSLGRSGQGGNLKAGGHNIFDDDVSGSRFGDIFRKIGKNIFQLLIIRRDDNIGRRRRRSPVIQCVDIDAAISRKPDTVDGHALCLCCIGNRCGILADGGQTISKHNHHPGVVGGRIKKLEGFGKSIRVIRPSVGSECIHACLQIRNRSNELGILSGSIRKADNANSAAETNLSVLGTVRSLIYDVNKFFRPIFQVGKRTSGHASGTVKNQNNIRRVGDNIRLRCQGELYGKGLPAVNAVRTQFFVGIRDSHFNQSFLSGYDIYFPARYMICPVNAGVHMRNL